MSLRYRALPLGLFTLLLIGCGPSYETEYKAALAELETTKQALAEAQRKLNAADHETRSKIFSLVRRTKNHLAVEKIDSNMIDKIQQEMKLLTQSYAQLNGTGDLTATTAMFYSDKLAQLLQLQRDSSNAYNHQYNACLSDLDSKGNKSELSTMLCEVQADAAGREPRQRYEAHVESLRQIGEQLHRARLNDSPIAAERLENDFQAAFERQFAKRSG